MDCLCTAGTFMQRHDSTARKDLKSMKLESVSVYCSNMTEIGWDIIEWHYSPDGRKPPLIRFHSLT
jgi:hypothetical protein